MENKFLPNWFHEIPARVWIHEAVVKAPQQSAGELGCSDRGSRAAACVARVITQLIFKGLSLS